MQERWKLGIGVWEEELKGSVEGIVSDEGERRLLK